MFHENIKAYAAQSPSINDPARRKLINERGLNNEVNTKLKLWGEIPWEETPNE